MRAPAFLIPFFISWAVWAQDCEVRRGALDIGSGSTKAFAAIVDICKKRIVKTLFDEKIPLGFGEAREKNIKNEIPPEMIDEATGKIGGLLKKMKALDLSQISGVATAAFRAATNGSVAAAALAKKLEIPIQVLSQEDEARVGAESALANVTPAPRPMIVWDIGGGSMQMWAPTEKGPEVYKGDLASVTFKNRVIRELQGHDPAIVTSPNPLGAKLNAAVQMAEKHANKNVPGFFRMQSEKARWIGIGGVLALSVQKQSVTKGNQIRRSQLEAALRRRSVLKDAQIPGDYKTTEITNLALVLGYMKALNIATVETVEASLTQGWLLRQP